MGAEDDGTGATTSDDGAKAAEPPEKIHLLPRLPSLSEIGLLEKRPPMLPALAETISNPGFAAEVYDWGGGEMMTTATSARHHPAYPTHRSAPGYHSLSRPPMATNMTMMNTEMMNNGMSGVRRGSWHPCEEHYLFYRHSRPTLPPPQPPPGDYRVKYEKRAMSEYSWGSRPPPPPLPYLAGVPWRDAGPIPNRGLPSAPYGTDYGLPRKGIVTSPQMSARGHDGNMMAMEALMAAAARYPAVGPPRLSISEGASHPKSGALAAGESKPAETSPPLPVEQHQQQHQCDFPSCGKSFPSKSRLQRHLFVHTGERPFACLYPQCERHFSRKDNMLQHYRTHLVKGPSAVVPPSKRASQRAERK